MPFRLRIFRGPFPEKAKLCRREESCLRKQEVGLFFNDQLNARLGQHMLSRFLGSK